MSRKVEFFFDVVSPYSYVAAVQVSRSPLLADAQWRPFLLGGVFKATGNHPPIAVPAKGQYMAQDLQRLFGYYDMPYCFPSVFPASSLTAMRALSAAEPAQVKALALKLFAAYWGENRNIAEQDVLLDILGPGLLARATEDAVKERLKANTEEAVQRGAFGAPTIFMGSDMYFGEDRVFLVEHALKQA